MKERYLTFSWHGKTYAVPISTVSLVLRSNNMVRTNRDELKITGHNNRVLPVIDPLSMFSVEESRINRKSRVLVTQLKGFKVGVLVDEIFGVEEIPKSELEKPSINEMRFVTKTYKKIKVVELEQFVTKDVANMIRKAQGLEKSVLTNGQKIHTNFRIDNEYVMDEIKMEMLNFLLVTNERKLDEYYLNSISRIHKMVENL